MSYSTNILPKSSAYYSFNRASISGSNLLLEAGGYAEISVSHQMLPKLTPKMLVVIHPSIFADYYNNDAVQVSISIILTDGTNLEYLVSASKTTSGVFNTELEFPEEEFISFTYRIFSEVEATVYNWELCAEEAVNLTTVIEGVEQELPKLLYDYNVYAYVVEQNEITVGLISCYLLNATDLQGHFTISFFATERCNVHIRIKDNNVTELFTPLVYTVEKGYASISVPHAYLKKLATTHAFSVTMQCTNGQLSIPVRGMLYTIDGGYLATRLLDAGIDIQDLSIKQLPTDDTPSEIYAIGFEGIRLILKSRVYSHAQRADWIAIKDFGEGITAGVEFYGRWQMRTNLNNYTLETDNTPFVFILGLDNVLRSYSGASFDIEDIIDTDVTAIGVCQGFNSMYNVEQDQGLVIVYIKQGNVYYKQWMYNVDRGAYIWHGSPAIYDQGDAIFTSIHRLPDYRLGICVQSINGTKWYITDRTYVSQAVKPEIANVETHSLTIATVIATDKVDTFSRTGIPNQFDEGPLSFNNFYLTFEGPIILLDNHTISDLKNAMIVKVNDVNIKDLATPNEIDKVIITDNIITIIFKNEIQGGKTVTVNFNMFTLVMGTYNNCWAEITQNYTWNLPLPTFRNNYNETTAVSVSGDLSVEVKQLIENKYSYQENFNVSVGGILDTKVKALKDNKYQLSESITTTVSGSVDITVTMIGVSPI